MTFQTAIKLLKISLKKKQPKTFSSTWICIEAPSAYRYIWKNIRTENNDINWDRVTQKLSRKFQKRWIRYRRKFIREYENQTEVDLILAKHRPKLYTIIAPTTPQERRVQERIVVALVRIGQKGNLSAQCELIHWLTFIIEEWIERRWQVYKWKGYTDDLEDKIKGCIRGYKYTGTFIGYLFKTLHYSSRALRPMVKYSLDAPVFDGDELKINYIIHDQQTL